MKLYMRIDGMFCNHCKQRITSIFQKDPSIEKIKIKNGVAEIVCENDQNKAEWIRRICEAGYETKAEWISEKRAKVKNTATLKEFLLILVALLLAAYVLQKIFGYNIFNVIPQIDSSLTYGMLVVTGLFTSIHCISMCGAVNLTAVSRGSSGKLNGPILYNFGRVLSYTLTGALAGALGSSLSMSSTAQGIVITAAAVLMLLMALNMLGVLDLSTPSCMVRFRNGQSSFVIGLLNGLMPCGPLQAMQLYSAGTGSIAGGALAMFLFGIGTVPLMLGMGLLLKFQGEKWQRWITRISAVLIFVLSIVTLNRGMLALGIQIKIPGSAGKESVISFSSDVDQTSENTGSAEASKEEDNCQIIEGELTYNSYGDYVVKKGIPVRLILHAEKQYLTGCNGELLIPDFDIDIKLKEGDNVIEFTPTEAGTYTITCWMYMITNTITVE